MAESVEITIGLRQKLRRSYVQEWARRYMREWARRGSPRNRAEAALRQRYHEYHVERFFAKVIGKGDLVFDIGAHVGQWTRSFRRLGAEVVAVEPQETSVAVLRKAFRHDPLVHIVHGAVGAHCGTAELMASRPCSDTASIAPDFVAALIRSGRMPTTILEGIRETVTVTTLDRLIETFGRPAYCKIDVEGSELQVIQGLSQPVPLLSFEFHGEVRQNAEEIVARLSHLDQYEYNHTDGDWLGLKRCQWIDERTLVTDIRALGIGAWGNVFAIIPPRNGSSLA
jgi:FkbM family methyltransferase